jgi:hypothetical protein
MNEHEDELKRALAENGNCDADKAENEAGRARRGFDSRLKWSGRFAWMRIILVVVVFEFAFVNFILAHSTRAMIGYAAMMVITIVLVGVIAVQSWVAGMKIGLLKEIKLLRLERLGQSTSQDALPELEASPLVASTRRALSAGEYLAWILALAVFAWGSGFAALRLSADSWPAPMAQFDGAPVTVEAPHLGAPIYYTIYLRMEQGVCKVARVTPEHKRLELFSMGEGYVTRGTLPPGDSLRLDPQGNQGAYWVRFE